MGTTKRPHESPECQCVGCAQYDVGFPEQDDLVDASAFAMKTLFGQEPALSRIARQAAESMAKVLSPDSLAAMGTYASEAQVAEQAKAADTLTLAECIAAVEKLREVPGVFESQLPIFDGFYRNPIHPQSVLGREIERLKERGYEVLTVVSLPGHWELHCKAPGTIKQVVWDLRLGFDLELPSGG